MALRNGISDESQYGKINDHENPLVIRPIRYKTIFDENGRPIQPPQDPKHPFMITPITFDRRVYFKDGKAHDLDAMLEAKRAESKRDEPKTPLLADDVPKGAEAATLVPPTIGEKPKWMADAANLCRASAPPPDSNTIMNCSTIGPPAPERELWRPRPELQVCRPQLNKKVDKSSTAATGRSNKDQNTLKVARTEAPKAYDLAGELMKQLPMRMVNEALYVFNGRAYEFVTATVMHRLIMAYCRNAVSIVGDASIIKRVYEVIEAEPAICIREVKILDVVSFENGLLDLVTFTMHPHTPAIFVTAQVQGEFRPEIPLTCPVFDRFLDQTTGGDPVLVQRI